MAKKRSSKPDAVEALARQVADLAFDHKAQNIVVIDVRERSGYADFLVIATGTSDRHVQAVAEGVRDGLNGATGRHPIGVEGLREGQWALVDYGPVVLHVFHPFTREVYKLEDLWKDAPRLTVEAVSAPKSRRRS
ncbi:MAG: ribosome silencing factor [Deltaproteobacteria bacterium]|nr:ribosome silencing factor [Deltaproteobacteria bacterium]